MSSKTKSDKSPKSGNQKNQFKPKRSFLPRLPSFRKKKSASPTSQADKDKSPNSNLSKEEPIIGRTKPGQYVMRRSKTSELVASFEKRLSDLKEDDPKSPPITKLDNSKGERVKTPTSGTSKFSRFGFKGIAAHRISNFENRNNNGNGENDTEEINANSPPPPTSKLRKPVTLSNRNSGGDNRRTRTDFKRSESTSSAKSPDSQCSSPGSLGTTKVLGLPMPYRSVFSDDEPRGLKRQASSQSVDPISSGMSTASTSSTPSPCVETMLAADRADVSHRAMLNATFSLSEPRGLNVTYTKEPLDSYSTTAKYDCGGSGTRFSKGVYKTKDIRQAFITSSAPTSPACVLQERELTPAKETLISHHSESMPHSSTSALTVETLGALSVTRPNVGSDGESVGQGDNQTECQAIDSSSIHGQESGSETSNKSRNKDLTATVVGSEPCDSVSEGNLDIPVDIMGTTQSSLNDPTAISTPVRPLYLSLKPHLSAIKHVQESFDSAELDSLGSDDLMCDSRYLEDETFPDQIGEESRLSRSCGMEIGAHRYNECNRSRTSSLDQVTGTVSVDKRTKLNRGMSIPSPLGVTPASAKRRGWGSRPASRSVSAMEELGQLIGSTFLSESYPRHQFGVHNTNRNRSNSSLTSTTHPLRPPRWLSHQDGEEEEVVVVDAVVYRHMLQDITYLKTMLLRLKRALQQTETSSPFEHPLRSPFNSVPTSPMSDAYLLPESTAADLAEENQVLRKEVRKLQELLVDKESDLNTLSKQLVKPHNKHTGTQCEDTLAAEQPASSSSLPSASSSSASLPLHHTTASSSCTDKCLQVDLPLNSFPLIKGSSTTASPSKANLLKYRSEVSRITAAYEEYIRLHDIRQGHQLQPQYTFYDPTEEQKLSREMDEQRQQQQQQQFAEQQPSVPASQSPASQPQQHEVVEEEKHHQQQQQEQTSRYQQADVNMYSMARCESMTSSTSSLTSEETRSSSRSLTSPTKKMEVVHTDDLDSQEEQSMDQQQSAKQLQRKISSDENMSSDSTQKTKHSDETERQEVEESHKVTIPPYPSPSKMPSPSQFRYQTGAAAVSPTKQRYQQQQTVSSPTHQQAGSPKKKEPRQRLEKQSMYSSELKQGLTKKKKQKSKSRLVAPSSVSSKVISQKAKESGQSPQSSPTRGALKKPTHVTEIETVTTTSWEPLVDVPSNKTKYKSIMIHPATTAHKSNLPMTGGTKSSIQALTAYSSYQQKSGLRAPSQRVNQMPTSLPSHKATSHHQPDSRSSSSCSGSNERLSDATLPISPKCSSPQHTSLQTTLSQPVPSSGKFRSGLPSPKRARQIPMGVTQMQSQMAASANQNKSPKRSSPGNGRRDGPVVKPMKTQEQVWEKQVMNGSNYSEQGMRGVQTSLQRQIRQPGSKIAIPIRGRGGSKLQRTSGIPGPQRFDSNM